MRAQSRRGVARLATRALPLLLLLLGLLRVRHVAALQLQPTLVLDSSTAAGVVRNVTFVEGGAPTRLATGQLQLTEANGPCVSAVVRITNPIDAPQETLAVAPDRAADVAVAYNATSGVMTLTVSAAQLTGAAGTRPTAALAGALSWVTYSHASKAPDASPRAVVFVILDAAGIMSQPAVAVVTITPVPDPPVLRLAGPGGTGAFAAVLLESERVTPVAIADPKLTLTDVDSDVMLGATVKILNRLDGAAERLEVDVAGTSISASYDNATAVLALSGLDTLDNYRAALGSVRYCNPGKLVNETLNFTLANCTVTLVNVTVLRFTAGVRTIAVVVRDPTGQTAAANATVTCVPVPRVGTVGRDPALPAPPDCSGAGNVTDDGLCQCNCGYEGDLCEIPPCNGHGLFSPIAFRAGVDACSCYPPYKGPTCGVACSGVGTVLPDGKCKCNPGRGGIDCSLTCPGCGPHGLCTTRVTIPPGGTYPDNTVTTCGPCDPGWAGVNCTLPCPCYVGNGSSTGTCVVSATCVCTPGWTGDDCSVQCPACVSPASGGGGSCKAPTGLQGGLTFVLAQLAASVQSTGDTVAASALLSTYAAAGTVVGVALVNGSFAAADSSAHVEGVCACNATLPNRAGGVGFAGADCSVQCRRCVRGTCDATGGCVCFPGYVGGDCSTQCSGNGAVTWPPFSGAYTAAVWDALYGPHLNITGVTSPGGLFNTSTLYGFASTDGGTLTLAYCACTPANPAAGRYGFTGPFCGLVCPNCGAHGACVTDASGAAACKCSTTDPNNAATTSAIAIAAGKATGVGWTGPLCTVPCKPCVNGTCDARGFCACSPGFSDDACALECGAVGNDPPTGLAVGKRGTLVPLGAAAGYGLNGTRAVCACDAGWAGPTCTKPCPFPYNATHGICALKNASDADYNLPWATRVVCAPGWTGLPPEALRLPSGAVGAPGRTCSLRCSPCDASGGACQDGGECACAYGRLWQGPLSGGRLASYPYPQLKLSPNTFVAAYHTCAARHPCNANGEYINATCVGVLQPGSGTPWTQAAPLDGGWGCSDAASAAPGNCSGGTILFAMAYAEVDATTGLATRRNPPLATFAEQGTIQGGVCLPAPGAPAGALPIAGGVCRCDGLARGRFKFPSSAALPGGAYDYDFQGWAGPACDIPCAPCSVNGACAPADGACVCHAGWAGYRCQVPCEPCAHGTCAGDGSCVCDGGRRRQDGSYALRLTRDPLYEERGVHTYEVAGAARVEYVSPAYSTAALVEDFLWEAEYECAARPSCAGRTPDTQLPARPNETYFRYGTAYTAGAADAESPAAKLAALDARITALRAAVAGVPTSMNGSTLCDIPGPNVGLPSQGPDACLVLMAQRKWGRTLASCGAGAAAQPWGCDDNLKAQFVLQTQAEVGRLLVERSQLSTTAGQSSLSETRWLLNNRNERQRLLATQVRGALNVSAGTWSAVRDPDYYAIWIMHQLLYGVTYGGGYTGWNCSVPCEACDPSGGSCQFDGSCECVPGRYGADCSLNCSCATLGAGGGASTVSASGRTVAAGGACGRDGACACFVDSSGLAWAGDGCFTPCVPCAHGACNATDGSCVCEPGWTGAGCSVSPLVDCLPCDAAHGTCRSDGTCACDAGWTGLDCATRCAPCAHGDCQLDGACFCRDGWAGADCGVHLGAPLVRAAFRTTSGGWRAYNNSCAAAADDGGAAAVPPPTVLGVDGDDASPAVGALPPACDDTTAGGDSGLTWDAGTGCLYMADYLPADDVAGQVAYFRAPPPFLGNQLGAYAGVLAWSAHLAGDADSTPPGAPHAPGAAPDAILIGGLPAFNLSGTDWAALSREGLFNWSRARFPELRLNRRWSRARLADTLGAYLQTPQVVLHYYAPAAAGAANGTPPLARCTAADCSLNFAAPLWPGAAAWRNAPGGLPPGTWGWADTGDPAFVARLEGTAFLGATPGSSYNPFALSPPGGVPLVPSADASLAARAAGGAAASAGVTAWTWQQGDGPAPGPLGAGTLGTATAAESDGNNAGGTWEDPGRAGWDVLPHVLDAISLARGPRAGLTASAAELAWCLASLKELLLRADYLNASAAGRAPAAGPGEAVRLDDVALTGPDPLRANASLWEAAEAAAYLEYARRYAAAYSSAYMQHYVEQHGG